MYDQAPESLSAKEPVVTRPDACDNNMAYVLSKLKTVLQQHRTLAQCVGVVTGCLLAMAAFLSRLVSSFITKSI